MSESGLGGPTSGNGDCSDNSCECPTCGRDDFKKPGDMKLHHYHTHGESIAMKTVECAFCGEAKKVTAGEVKRRERFFCDTKCKGKWQSQNWDASDHPRYDGGKIDVACDWCGDKRKMWPSQVDHAEHHFCKGKDCHRRWRSENFSGEDSPRWKGGYSPYYGENWIQQRQKALKRDQYRCQGCNKNASDMPREPSVHHIIPVRDFERPSDANSLGNLVTLCNACHAKWEGLYLRPDTR